MRGGRRWATDGAQVANDALELSGWPAREAGVRMCVEQQTRGLHGDDGVVGLLGDTKVFAAKGV
jgi:hypothetical protein